AARRTSDQGAAGTHQTTALTMAQGAIEQLKALSFSLRPAQLDLLGLASTVETALELAARPAGLDYDFLIRGEEPAALGENASVAVRLVQEALDNVVRHAGATRVVVRLRFLADARLGVLVLDDGKGFDPGHWLAGPEGERDRGLHAMSGRTELAGGRLRVRSRPGRGVALRAVL
ncbi:MAG TPA: ATP-binding protein, partial [Ramlibacter sp.]|nr:ATP-binding protein [Ramlibacter sp.]